jgi:hypothetical protein
MFGGKRKDKLFDDGALDPYLLGRYPAGMQGIDKSGCGK